MKIDPCLPAGRLCDTLRMTKKKKAALVNQGGFENNT